MTGWARITQLSRRLSQIPGPDAARLNGGKTVASGGLFQGACILFQNGTKV